MGLYNIAGIITQMEPKGAVLRNNCKKYELQEGTADIKVTVPEDEIEQNLKQFPKLSRDEWEYLLAGIHFYRYLLRYDGMMLHASAVVVDGRAYLFSGNPGSGKSTHSALWLKLFGDRAYIINDDKPAIRRINGNFIVYGTPFSGKNNISENQSAPLAGICFVEKSDKNSIDSLDKGECIPMVLQQTLHRLSKREMDSLLSILDGMLERIPIFSLKCNLSTEAALLSYNTMKEAAPDVR